MEETDQKKINILIVDDDLDVLTAMRDCFASLKLNNPCEITVETSPENAIQHIKTGFFDLVFCDYNFYGSTITGLEIFGEIKKVYQDRTCVGVLITSWGTTELFTSEQAAGLFSDFIEKPFSEFDNLKVKINNAITLLTRRREAEDRLETDK